MNILYSFPRVSWDNLRHDFSAGLVVFLISLPLCIGIGFASGAPIVSG